jgi:hypothetical protein
VRVGWIFRNPPFEFECEGAKNIVHLFEELFVDRIFSQDEHPFYVNKKVDFGKSTLQKIFEDAKKCKLHNANFKMQN